MRGQAKHSDRVGDNMNVHAATLAPRSCFGPASFNTSAQDPWDAIVVGAGPAGSSLAIRLARAGMRVLVVERAAFPRDKLCGEFLGADCWPLLDELGVADAVRASGCTTIRRARVWVEHRLAADGELPVGEAGPAAGLGRARLDQLLLNRATQLGAAVLNGTEVTGLLRQGGRIVGVRTRTPGRAAAAGEQISLAPVTIAADGRRSRVVRESGRTRCEARPGGDRVCAVKRHYVAQGPADPKDAIDLYSFPGGYAGTCRVAGELSNLCSLLPIATLRRARGNIDAALLSVLGRSPAAGWIAEGSAAGAWQTVPDVSLQRSYPALPGVLYVGDAMGTVDPVGGEGMAMAFEGARLAVRFVKQAVARGACDTAVQDAYRAAWSHGFGPRIALCRLFGRVLARPGLVGGVSALRPAWSRFVLPWAYRATRGGARAGTGLG